MKVAIIGGGASGLICANRLSTHGLELTVFEKNNVLGRKLSATGNGRGNLANEKTALTHFHSKNPELLENWFLKLNETEIFNILKDCGITLAKDYRGRFYPLAFEAKSVAKILTENLFYKGVTIRSTTEVTAVLREGNGFKLIFDGHKIGFYDVLVLATGGLAAPQLGADEFGLKVLENFGHQINATSPAIVHLRSDSPYLKRLDGLKWVARLSFEGQEKNYLDEVHFAKDALSGPCAFQASIGYQKIPKKPKTLKLDFLPNLDQKMLETLLVERKNRFLRSEVSFLLMGLLPEKLIRVLLEETNLLNKRIRELSEKEVKCLAKKIKNFYFPLLGTRNYKFAQSTLGGASLLDFELSRFESKKVKNLYAIGELLDVCGDCGGYNLYFAWLSGILAAEAISKKGKGEIN